jgi:N-acetylglutamate synthase-like GNAT family acetyltransferase
MNEILKAEAKPVDLVRSFATSDDAGPVQLAVFAASSPFRSAVQLLRRWCLSNRDRVAAELDSHVTELHSLRQAADWCREAPRRRVLVTVGCDLSQLNEEFSAAELDTFEVIIHKPEWTREPLADPTASLVAPTRMVTFKSPVVAIRKSLLRLSALRVFATVRPLETADQFRDYFRLRYRVWKGLGYLTDEMDCAGAEIELNYSDRTAIPFGAFDSRGGLVGCARLVQGFGMESPHHVRLIKALIADSNLSSLARCFEYPAGLIHPFDVLEAFPNFVHYYRRLVLEGVLKAEVSRVIIDPAHQHHGLGEVLVDSLVSYANSMGLTTLFLACQEKHEKFYERSGFRRIPDVKASHFINIDAPSIAMERCEQRRRSADAHADAQ